MEHLALQEKKNDDNESFPCAKAHCRTRLPRFDLIELTSHYSPGV